MIRIHRPTCPNLTVLSTNYKHADNKDALIAASNGKCMYCETQYLATGYCEVEHIRPKSIYPHLEFIWENLGLVCRICNNSKLNNFSEEHPFINPYEENPRDFLIAAGPLLKAKQDNQRGKVTIDTIKLNRTSLFEKRKEKIEDLKKLLMAIRSADIITRANLIEIAKDWTIDSRDHSFVLSHFLESELTNI